MSTPANNADSLNQSASALRPVPAGSEVQAIPDAEQVRTWGDADPAALDQLIEELRQQVPRPSTGVPRGLLPRPPLVAALVIRETRQHRLTPKERRRLEDTLTLQYYFEDRDVLFRHTPQGVEVLAVGMEEITQALQQLPPEQRREWTFGQG